MALRVSASLIPPPISTLLALPWSQPDLQGRRVDELSPSAGSHGGVKLRGARTQEIPRGLQKEKGATRQTEAKCDANQPLRGLLGGGGWEAEKWSRLQGGDVFSTAPTEQAEG